MDDEIVRQLKAAVRGEVRFDPLTRQLYSTDASHYRVVPHGVVLPRDADDIAAVLEVAGQYDLAVLPRGGGTSLSGQSVGQAIIVDTSRYLDSVLEVNIEEQWVRVQPGVVLDHLNARLRPHGLMFGPDPASSAAATLGGMLGNNSTGSHSIVYGMTADHTLELEVMLADGRRVRPGPNFAGLDRDTTAALRALLERCRPEIEARYPKTWRTVAGYDFTHLIAPEANLARLFVGSEGTLGIITEAKLKLVRRPATTALVILRFDSLAAALTRVPLILETKPSAVELIDKFFLDLTRRVPAFAARLTFVDGDPRCLFIVEYAGDTVAEMAARIQQLKACLAADRYGEPLTAVTSPEDIANVWTVRKAGFGLLMSLRGDAKPLAFVDDATVPADKLAEYAGRVEAICREAGTEAAFYAHASAGCLHINPLINLKTAEGLRRMRIIAGQVATTAIALGGTTTGEHGEGLARSCFNQQLFGPALHQAFREVKRLLDPDWRLNPGKIIDAPDMAEPSLLRYNPAYHTTGAPARTSFAYPAEGSFAGLVEMCNGQGVCRARGAGVMCPSFMATRDERHATRGRANALRAAISGQLPGGLDSLDLYDTLDLCLSCKACKSECPSTVDMAKLKAEYLAGYYERHGLPLRNRIFGQIAAVNVLGRWVRPLTNWGLRNRVTKSLLVRMLGLDSRRELPLLAPQTFEGWFRARPVVPPSSATKGEVVLWHDTFMNENDPVIGQAAVKVLEAAGYCATLVAKVCCGRPMISKGMLAQAKRNAAHNIHALAPYAERGIPILGCEPSCVSALRDEYPDLWPDDPRARLVADRTFFFDEWIVGHAESLRFDGAPRTVLYHPHCHQRALGAGDSLAQLFALILNCAAASSSAGCCGMAGSFGYEAEHYDLSMQIGADRLFPAVRGADSHTVIAAPGTSCRQQISHGAGRRARHPVEILAEALQ